VTSRSGHGLTELQQSIVDFVWSNGPSTAEQVREGISPGHRLKDSTIRTILRRLEERGFVSHTTEGKSFVYRVAGPSQSVAARTVQQLIQRFWSGSAEQFLAGMVDEKVLTPAQIRKLADKIKKK
jgi:BlaI family transcriptional regulator, penicillinase repressor